MDSQSPPAWRGFEAGDESPVQPFLVDYLERVGRRPDMRRVDALTYRMLAVAPGDHVLEVGSGLGDDAIELARRAGPAGRVVGLDLSSAFTSIARRRAEDAGVQVEFRIGDMSRLEFEGATFDGVRVERTLQYAPDAGTVLRELARVLKPGGRLVAAEPDWGSLSVDLMDEALVEQTVAYVLDRFRAPGASPRVGLQLPRHLADAGLTDLQIEIVTIIERSLDSAGEVLPMFRRELPPDIQQLAEEFPLWSRWREALEQADARRRLVATLQMWVVGGRKSA
jgi:SAM-dependent methyltransferase